MGDGTRGRADRRRPPGESRPTPPQARGWRATAALDAVLAALALTGAVVLAAGLVALPALIRFLRAGGWPKIRRRIGWAAGATVVAGGGLAGLVLVAGSRSTAQLNGSWAYLVGFFATGLAMTVAIELWADAAAATARHLRLAPRVRVAQLMLGAVTPTTVTVTVVTLACWWAVTQTTAWWLGVALVTLGLGSVNAWLRIRVAAKKGRRLHTAARNGTINPSAQRTQGRHRA